MGRFQVLTADGDEVIDWNPEDSDSVANAKKEWDRLKEQGFEFFEIAETKGKRVTRFNKNLGRVIAAPGVQVKADKESGRREKAMSGGPRAMVVR